MLPDELLNNVFTYLKSVGGLPKIFYPNINYTTIPSEYIIVNIMPIEPDDIGIKEVTMNGGLIQIDCVTLDGMGALRASEIAKIIINAFKRGTVISGIRIDRTSYASQGFNDGAGHYKIPVTIAYNFLTA